jgi:FkbM family methyltransferase
VPFVRADSHLEASTLTGAIANLYGKSWRELDLDHSGDHLGGKNGESSLVHQYSDASSKRASGPSACEWKKLIAGSRESDEEGEKVTIMPPKGNSEQATKMKEALVAHESVPQEGTVLTMREVIFYQSRIERAPFLFTLGRKMLHRAIPGGWRLTQVLKKRSSRKTSPSNVGDRFSIYVPAEQPERYAPEDLVDYERELLDALVQSASAKSGPITFVDCGADIGLMSILIAKRLPRIAEIIALEPNAHVFSILQRNLGGLAIRCSAVLAGASDFNGRGELRSPDYDNSDHGRYLAPVSDGGFPVMTVDSLQISAQTLILKIDVEGGELGVIHGAAETIKRAEAAIIAVEAHPKVAKRTGIDPVRVLSEMAGIRPFRFQVAELPDLNLNLSRPFFDQVRDSLQVYNIVGTSDH